MSKLKLLAFDAEDLQVISSCCQDAVLKVSDLRYLHREKRFALLVNRFAWEILGSQEANRSGTYERRKSVLHFERVDEVKVSGIDRSEKDMVLSLLAITFSAKNEPGGTIELVFAGDGAIRLSVECVEAQLSDQDASWGTGSKPVHTNNETD